MKVLRPIVYVLLVFAITTANAQSKEDRSLDSFWRISVGEAITVYLTEGSSEKATVEAKESLFLAHQNAKQQSLRFPNKVVPLVKPILAQKRLRKARCAMRMAAAADNLMH